MVTDLLHDQHIRRRNGITAPSRPKRSERTLDRQPMLAPVSSGRLLGVVQTIGLILAVAGLTIGLVVVSQLTGNSAVVADDVQRASLILGPADGSDDAVAGMVADDAAGAEPTDGPADRPSFPQTRRVEIERTEPMEYLVEPGESLSGIAGKFDTTYDVLAAYNNLDDPDTLVPGQRLMIPSVPEILDFAD